MDAVKNTYSTARCVANALCAPPEEWLGGRGAFAVAACVLRWFKSVNKSTYADAHSRTHSNAIVGAYACCVGFSVCM